MKAIYFGQRKFFFNKLSLNNCIVKYEEYMNLHAYLRLFTKISMDHEPAKVPDIIQIHRPISFSNYKARRIKQYQIFLNLDKVSDFLSKENNNWKFYCINFKNVLPMRKLFINYKKYRTLFTNMYAEVFRENHTYDCNLL